MKKYIKDGNVCDGRVVYDAERDLWISNPTDEQLTTLGWAPVITPDPVEEAPEEIVEEEAPAEEAPAPAPVMTATRKRTTTKQEVSNE